MTNNVEIVNAAVSLIIIAALLAARFSGRARKRSLKRLSKMEVDEKDKEIIFLRERPAKLRLWQTDAVGYMEVKVRDHGRRKDWSGHEKQTTNMAFILLK